MSVLTDNTSLSTMCNSIWYARTI